MKMSKFTKIILIFVLALVLILAAAFSALAAVSYKPTVAFYNLNEKVQQAILTEISSMPVGKKGKNITYKTLVLDDSIPLSSQKEAFKSDLIFATMDSDVQELAKGRKIQKSNLSLLDGMPSTTRDSALTQNNKLCAVPVLYDFYQMDISLDAFNESKIGKIAEWKDLTKFLEVTSKDNFYPLVISAGNDKELLNTFGCLAEALAGKTALEDAETRLYKAFKTGKTEEVNKAMESLLTENKGFAAALSVLRDFNTNKYWNPSALSFQESDSLYFMKNMLCNSAFITLSQHRQINNKSINEYASIYIPGASDNNNRSFCSPVVCALPVKNKKSVNSTIGLLTSSRQGPLSAKSGLAPVQASSPTPDKQADDVRFWIAASNGPVMPLGSALPSAEMKKAAAETIRYSIRK